jgi:cardiolipin-specific phospholipase
MYAVDWLGMGRSARVPFVVKATRTDVVARVDQAEAFFIDALEEWRVKQGIERFQLVGHSLGGYLSVAYALRYPERVSKLILVSPAGIPRGGNTEAPGREVTDSQQDTVEGPPGHRGPAAVGGQRAQQATRPKVERIRKEQEVEKQKESTGRRILTYLWEEGWSPFQVVRSTGIWGPMIIGKVSRYNACSAGVTKASFQYSSRRFSGLTEEETRDMHDYIQQITLAKGSGEYCICKSFHAGLR